MQLTMRPYVTAGVALVGASVIAVAPVVPSQALHAPTLPQVHMPAVQLTALDNPLEVFAPIVTAVQQLLGDTANTAATSINPLLRQVVVNQLYTLQQAQQLIGNVAGGLGTIGAALPGTLQAVGAQLATGNVNGAIDAFQSGIISGGLQLITGISQPIQNIVQRPLAVASALVPAMITTVQSLVIFAVGSTIGIGCSDCVTVKPIVQQMVSSIQSVLQAVTTLNPINVINAVQHGIADVTIDVIKQVDQFVTDAVPFIASTIQAALNVNPNAPGGVTVPPAAGATTAAAVKVSTVAAAAPKATDPAAVPAVTPADSSPAATPASATKDGASTPATKPDVEPTSGTSTGTTGTGTTGTGTTGSGATGTGTTGSGATGTGTTGSGATGSGTTGTGTTTGSTKSTDGSAAGTKGSTGGTKTGDTPSGDTKSGGSKSGDAGAAAGATHSGTKSGASKSGDSESGTAAKPKAVKAGGNGEGSSSHAASGAGGGHAE